MLASKSVLSARNTMLANSVHVLLLLISLSSIFGLAIFKPKRIEHFLFAALALSFVLMSVSSLLPRSYGIEQQLIALGTFATCNVFWLFSRSIFRKGNALTSSHYWLAGVIALLILSSRSIDIFVSLEWIEQNTIAWIKRSLGEMLQLLSSGVILLAFWEAIRSYSSSNKRLRKQKALIASSMFIAVLSTRVIAPSIPTSPEISEMIYVVVRAISASVVLISSFIVLWLQFKERNSSGQNTAAVGNIPNEEDELLVKMQHQMEEHKLYLQTDLKMMDFTNIVGEPEYKISRVLRSKTSFDNFNQFVNSYRIEYAKGLLKHNQNWTILVVSMESGFASLATFNRVFKSQEGSTPNQYRKKDSSLL